MDKDIWIEDGKQFINVIKVEIYNRFTGISPILQQKTDN